MIRPYCGMLASLVPGGGVGHAVAVRNSGGKGTLGRRNRHTLACSLEQRGDCRVAYAAGAGPTVTHPTGTPVAGRPTRPTTGVTCLPCDQALRGGTGSALGARRAADGLRTLVRRWKVRGDPEAARPHPRKTTTHVSQCAAFPVIPIAIVVAALLVLLLGPRWYQWRRAREAARMKDLLQSAGTITQTRQRILTREFLASMPPGTPRIPRFVVMDWDTGGGMVTLVAADDGAVSAYFGTGG